MLYTTYVVLSNYSEKTNNMNKFDIHNHYRGYSQNRYGTENVTDLSQWWSELEFQNLIS